MIKHTLKLLFLDPSRIQKSSKFIDDLEKIGIEVVFEHGAHPAYIVDTKLEITIRQKIKEKRT